MDSYIYGFALQEKTLPADITAAAETRRQDLTTADPSLASRFPHLIDVVDELRASGYDHTRQFERGLALILDGIEQLRHRVAKVARRARFPRRDLRVAETQQRTPVGATRLAGCSEVRDPVLRRFC